MTWRKQENNSYKNGSIDNCLHCKLNTQSMRIREYLDKSTFFSVYFAQRSVYRGIEQRLAPWKLNLHQAFVLVAVFFETESKTTSVSPKTLSDALGLSKGRISHVLCDLEEQNLILLKPSPDDRRKSLITLTPRGQKQALPLIALFSEYEEELDKNWSDQGQQLRKSLKTLY